MTIIPSMGTAVRANALTKVILTAPILRLPRRVCLSSPRKFLWAMSTEILTLTKWRSLSKFHLCTINSMEWIGKVLFRTMSRQETSVPHTKRVQENCFSISFTTKLWKEIIIRSTSASIQTISSLRLSICKFPPTEWMLSWLTIPIYGLSYQWKFSFICSVE